MRKKLWICLAPLFVIALICGCGGKSSGNGTKVVLNEVAHSIFYAPMYVAIEKGYFEDEGLDVELVNGLGADKTMTALLTGDADIGFMGPEASIYTYLEGATDYPINFAQLTQRAGNFVVAREPIDDFSYEMMVGKDVLGGRAGGMPQMVFEYVLKLNSIDPKKDVYIDQSVAFGSTAAAFAGSTAYDFTVEFEPFATSLELNNQGYIVASLGEDSGYVPYTAFCAKKSYMEEHPEIISSFVAAMLKGLTYTETHSAKEIASVIAPSFPDTDAKSLETIVGRYKDQDSWTKNLFFTQDSFTLLQNILESAGELEKRVPYEDLVDTSFVSK